MSMQWLVGAATVCVVGLAHFVTMVRSPRAVIYFDHFDFHQATLNRVPAQSDGMDAPLHNGITCARVVV